MRLEELEVYQLTMKLGEHIWKVVAKWNYFAKDIPINIGSKQLVRSADSISANLGEGYGKFFYKENRQFCYYSRGSLYETKTRLTKSHNRGLLSDADFQALQEDIEKIALKLNNYINSTGKRKNDINTQ